MLNKYKNIFHLQLKWQAKCKFLDLSPKIFNKLYDETNNIIDFSNYNITEADFTEPTFSNENIANVVVYSNTGVKSKNLVLQRDSQWHFMQNIPMQIQNLSLLQVWRALIADWQ